ncbi:MAG: SPFH domain-containing protein [Oscillospiraceae bacterium]|jgi:membrane protease subunit (stomatin/prohibitin family)|nr:SPFH domain-containing protein [Oscillospiraceae bacterium]
MAALTSVIAYEGDNTTFIWKSPVEDFLTGAQLIVHESQEAVFFLNGQALDLFGPGRHTLTTQNLPLVGKFFNRATDDISPFHCEVYFINKTEQMAIKWGTDSRLEYMDPLYGFPLQIGASGEMSLLADDARQLLVKLVGTEKTLTQQSLTQKFRAFLMTRLKSYLVRLIREEKINIFEIDEQLVRISEDLHRLLAPSFAEYGMALARFFVTTIVKPEEDRQYQRFKELHFRQFADIKEAQIRQQVGVIEQDTERQRMILEAQGLAAKRALEGYTYQEERGYDVAERIGGNPGVGEMSNLGIGLGMMAGVGGTVGSAVGGVMQGAMGGFAAAPQTAAPEDGGVADFALRLKKLELLKGKIPDELYEAKMQEILGEI